MSTDRWYYNFSNPNDCAKKTQKDSWFDDEIF